MVSLNGEWMESLIGMAGALPVSRYLKASVGTVAQLYADYPEGGETGTLCFVEEMNWFWTYDVRRRLWRPLAGNTAYDVWLGLPGNAGRPVTEFIESLRGARGASVYALWQALPGNAGRPAADFFASLAGEQGASAYALWQTLPGNAGLPAEDFFASLEGEKGPEGQEGQRGLSEEPPSGSVPEFFMRRPLATTTASWGYIFVTPDGRMLIYGGSTLLHYDPGTGEATSVLNIQIDKVNVVDGTIYLLAYRTGAPNGTFFRLNVDGTFTGMLNRADTGGFVIKATDGKTYFGVANMTFWSTTPYKIYVLEDGALAPVAGTNTTLFNLAQIINGETWFFEGTGHQNYYGNSWKLDDGTGTITKVGTASQPTPREIVAPFNGFRYMAGNYGLYTLRDSPGSFGEWSGTRLSVMNSVYGFAPLPGNQYLILGDNGLYLFTSAQLTLEKISSEIFGVGRVGDDGRIWLLGRSPDGLSAGDIPAAYFDTDRFAPVKVSIPVAGAPVTGICTDIATGPDGGVYLVRSAKWDGTEPSNAIYRLSENAVFARVRGRWRELNPEIFNFV
jgi:hypothetical protein